MKLSDAQIEALKVLAEQKNWLRPGTYGTRTNTLDALVAKGLAETRTQIRTLEYDYRITDAGRELLASLD